MDSRYSWYRVGYQFEMTDKTHNTINNQRE